MAGTTRLELATFGVTGRRSNQLNYAPILQIMRKVRVGAEIVNGLGIGPFPGQAFLFDPLERTAHQLAFEWADAVDKEFAIEMVDFMLQSSCIEAFAGRFESLAVDVGGFDFDPGIAFDVAIELGKTQTALLAGLFAFA